MIGLRFFPLKPADVRGTGTRDEPLRTSAWEATVYRASDKSNFFRFPLKVRVIGSRLLEAK